MDVGGLEAQLAELAAGANQREKATGYLTVLQSIYAASTPSPAPALIAFGRHFTTSSSITMVVGRRVLDAFVISLSAGSGLPAKLPAATEPTAEGDEEEWRQLGATALAGEKGEEVRKEVVEGILEGGGNATWCEEQTIILRHLLSHILQKEEDWQGAARALISIPLEGTSRSISDEDKLAVYSSIVRLLLECEESGQAQTYFSRASLLIHTTKDKETLLAYRLSQARLFDYSARFNEAAQRYHELSFDSAIDEEERLQILQAAVTTSILAPSGPQRSRILATLNRDDRVHSSLPPFLSTMLRKMLLEYIVRAAEMKEFEAGLASHQRAGVEGGGTVLERAVREHNVGACAKVYDNIGFDSLGSILGLDAGAAEVVARKMIEQGRLRAWIDQPSRLLFFESRSLHESDADAQGTAGGLGVEREEKAIEPVTWTERWDDRIRDTSMKVESIASAIEAKRTAAAS